jgi:hypothetical protein
MAGDAQDETMSMSSIGNYIMSTVRSMASAIVKGNYVQQVCLLSMVRIKSLLVLNAEFSLILRPAAASNNGGESQRVCQHGAVCCCFENNENKQSSCDNFIRGGITTVKPQECYKEM